jgi:two-component system chemotaxis response regulator CheB
MAMRREVVTVGASAGGVGALSRLVESLPAGLPASVFVVLHMPEESSSFLHGILARAGPLPAVRAENGQPIEPGRIYVATPGHHLLLERGRTCVVTGPRENGHRPAIDVLFRSAAQCYDGRVIGVLLTGNGDDGVAGLRAIREAGGLVLVQDPDEATFDGMPRSAMQSVHVDGVLPLSELAQVIAEEAVAPHGVEEVTPMGGESLAQGGIEALDRRGERTPLTCPECGGAIWAVDESGVERFRCHVGHAFSSASFGAMHHQAVESALWAAVRILDERGALLARLAERAEQRGRTQSAARFERTLDETKEQSEAIRRVVLSLAPDAAQEPSSQHSA